MTTKLTVTPTQPGYQRVSISGSVAMTEAEAHVAEILSLSGATEALALHESLDDALRGLAT